MLVGFVTIHRVMGELSVTRAIGDREYKGTLKNEYFGRCFLEDLVLAEPEITQRTLGPHDEFLILACDGLWDVFGNQEAVDYVKVRTVAITHALTLSLTRSRTPCCSCLSHSRSLTHSLTHSLTYRLLLSLTIMTLLLLLIAL